MSCTQNINWNINRNPTIVKDLDISSSTGIIKEVLIKRGGKNVIEWKTWNCAFYLSYRLENLFKKDFSL